MMPSLILYDNTWAKFIKFVSIFYYILPVLYYLFFKCISYSSSVSMWENGLPIWICYPWANQPVVVVSGTCVLGAHLHQISDAAFQLTTHAVGYRISKSFEVDLTRPFPTVNWPNKIKRLLNWKKVKLQN